MADCNKLHRPPLACTQKLIGPVHRRNLVPIQHRKTSRGSRGGEGAEGRGGGEERRSDIHKY